MKGFGFLCLFLLIGTAAFVYSTTGDTSLNPGNNVATWIVKNRKLTGIIYPHGSDKDEVGKVSLEDYRSIDPVPSSKASIRPGPIQHGSPLMPYIPKPCPPPSQWKHGG